MTKSIQFAKTYYEASISSLKKLDKHKTSIRNKIFQYNEDNFVGQVYYNEERENITNITNITEHKYSAFELISKEVKRKSTKHINETVALFFQTASVEISKVDLNKIDKVKITRQLKDVNIYERPRSVNANRIPREKNSNRYKRSNSDNKVITNNKISNTKTGKVFRDSMNTESASTNSNSYKEKENNFEEGLNTPKFCGDNIRSNIGNNICGNQCDNACKNSTNKTLSGDGRHKCPGNNYNNFNFYLPEENSSHLNNLNFGTILKKIGNAKISHAFLPANDFQNILLNTVEAVHRKFFELTLEEHFGKIFNLEKNFNSFIMLESIYNNFVYLRGLKLMLFNEKNKLFFSNIFFDV